MKSGSFLLLLSCLFRETDSLVVQQRISYAHDVSLSMGLFGGGSGISTIPSPSNRDKQAIDSIKAAVNKPKTPSFPLVECDFPPLAELNKMGDGSQRSANQVDDANLAFTAKLVQSLTGLPMIGPNVVLLTSASAPSSFLNKAKNIVKKASYVGSLKDGIPDSVEKGSIAVLVSPSSAQDYTTASKIASDGVVRSIVVVNGVAKGQKSIGNRATMAYFLKPLTYNSQVVGYLVRNYPNDWATIDLISNQVLQSYKDSEILFGDTNTPDLRGPGRLVQKFVDERAIQSRKN
eukprot:scaffold1561_cov129-Cylindrotheca_fusiformis.AAC.15